MRVSTFPFFLLKISIFQVTLRTLHCLKFNTLQIDCSLAHFSFLIELPQHCTLNQLEIIKVNSNFKKIHLVLSRQITSFDITCTHCTRQHVATCQTQLSNQNYFVTHHFVFSFFLMFLFFIIFLICKVYSKLHSYLQAVGKISKKNNTVQTDQRKKVIKLEKSSANLLTRLSYQPVNLCYFLFLSVAAITETDRLTAAVSTKVLTGICKKKSLPCSNNKCNSNSNTTQSQHTSTSWAAFVQLTHIKLHTAHTLPLNTE